MVTRWGTAASRDWEVRDLSPDVGAGDSEATSFAGCCEGSARALKCSHCRQCYLRCGCCSFEGSAVDFDCLPTNVRVVPDAWAGRGPSDT